MDLQSGRQYLQSDLPDNLFNISNGQTVNYNGRQYRGSVNGNGTRSFEALSPSFGNNSSSSFNIPQVNFDDVLAKQKASMDDLFSKQNQQQTDFINSYKSAIDNQEKLPDMQARVEGELGLPALRQNAQNLQNTLFKMPITQRDATRGFDVNQNQLDRIIAQKESELAPSAELASQNALNAENVANSRIGYGIQQQQKELSPFQTQASMLADSLARQFTGWTDQNKNELDTLLTKYTSGVQMSIADMNRLTQLSMQENDHEFQKNQLQQQFENNKALIPLQAQTQFSNDVKLKNLDSGNALSNAKALAQFNYDLNSSGIKNNPWLNGSAGTNNGMQSTSSKPAMSSFIK